MKDLYIVLRRDTTDNSAIFVDSKIFDNLSLAIETAKSYAVERKFDYEVYSIILAAKTQTTVRVINYTGDDHA